MIHSGFEDSFEINSTWWCHQRDGQHSRDFEMVNMFLEKKLIRLGNQKNSESAFTHRASIHEPLAPSSIYLTPFDFFQKNHSPTPLLLIFGALLSRFLPLQTNISFFKDLLNGIIKLPHKLYLSGSTVLYRHSRHFPDPFPFVPNETVAHL